MVPAGKVLREAKDACPYWLVSNQLRGQLTAHDLKKRFVTFNRIRTNKSCGIVHGYALTFTILGQRIGLRLRSSDSFVLLLEELKQWQELTHF